MASRGNMSQPYDGEVADHHHKLRVIMIGYAVWLIACVKQDCSWSSEVNTGVDVDAYLMANILLCTSC